MKKENSTTTGDDEDVNRPSAKVKNPEHRRTNSSWKEMSGMIWRQFGRCGQRRLEERHSRIYTRRSEEQDDSH